MKYAFLSKAITAFLLSKEIIREIKSSSRIISLAVKSGSEFHNNPDILTKHFKNVFYFNRPSEGFSYTAAGELVSLQDNGSGRFTSIDKQLKALKPRVITNWENTELCVPLFTGGMKFNSEHSDDDWKDFNDSNWIIPELILLRSNNENYIVCNFYFTRNSEISGITGYFEQKLCFIDDSKESPERLLKISSISGDSPKDRKKWKNMVIKALDHIDERSVNKIVLSRKIELLLDNQPVFTPLLKKLEDKYPECGIFMFGNRSSSFFGATPEKLISFRGKNILIDALAGSATNDSEGHLFSEKNINEHDFVIEHIRDVIKPFVDKIELTRYHNTKKLNNISHIWSEISAEMKDANVVFNLVKELFPTPAVCGTPKDTALGIIKKLEEHHRGLYAGLIGWFNFSDAEFYVSIRSALSIGKKIIAYAGCGIVNGSDPDEEFNETELKLIPILSLFKDENKIQPQHSLG